MKWPEEKTNSARLNNSFENRSIPILFRISFTKRRRSASNLESAKIGYFDQKIVVCSSALCTIGFSNQFTTEHGYLHSTREAKDAQWIRTIVVVATDMHIIPKTRFRVQKEGNTSRYVVRYSLDFYQYFFFFHVREKLYLSTAAARASECKKSWSSY